MQNEIDDGIIIACDFCGTEWDQVKPMVEGHRGSVICLDCVKLALDNAATGGAAFTCTLCLSDREAGSSAWRVPSPPDRANADAVICGSCIQQTAEAFGKDRSADFSYDGE